MRYDGLDAICELSAPRVYTSTTYLTTSDIAAGALYVDDRVERPYASNQKRKPGEFVTFRYTKYATNYATISMRVPNHILTHTCLQVYKCMSLLLYSLQELEDRAWVGKDRDTHGCKYASCNRVGTHVADSTQLAGNLPDRTKLSDTIHNYQKNSVKASRVRTQPSTAQHKVDVPCMMRQPHLLEASSCMMRP